MEPTLNFGMEVLAFVIIYIDYIYKKNLEGCYQGIFLAGCWIFLLKAYRFSTGVGLYLKLA